jgi:hypothetical protein
MRQETELRRTQVHRNLDYRFTIFGLIDAFDVIVVGTLAMSTMLICFFLGFALAWGIPVFVSGCLAMLAIRAGAPPDDLAIKLRAAFKPRHLSILGRDTFRMFQVSYSGRKVNPHV